MSSSTAVMQEQFTDQFNSSLKGTESPWLRGLRQEAFAYFRETGYPTPRNEDWKYTNVSGVESKFWPVRRAGQPTAAPALDSRFLELLRKFNYRRNVFTALNLSFAELFVIRIEKDTSIEKPIQLFFAGQPEGVLLPHILVIAEAGSKATFVETYAGNGFTNTAVQIIVEDNANLTHYRVQKEAPTALHIGTTEVDLGRGSLYNATNINIGAKLSRHDIELRFGAEGGEAFVDGLYMLNEDQHSDTHSVIDHALPNCVSHQNYKGVLNDRSRGVFNGKVLVRENASGTDAHQSNKNLLLSNDARVDTKPQLEIFNDDVKCAHGATVGQLEDEEVFYLLSRGLTPELSKNLLTYGFAEEIINKIGIESIKEELDEAVLNRLNAVI